MKTLVLLIASLIFMRYELALAGALIEQKGRFEIDWSKGVVRSYGTTVKSNQLAWRTAEQSAWADGLSYMETRLPNLLKSRLGTSSQADSPTRFSGLISATQSTNTTFYGDQRIKVTLEIPFAAALSQLSGQQKGASPLTSRELPLEVNLVVKKSATPSFFFSVEDENGTILVSASDMSRSDVLPRWFKGSASTAKDSAQAAALKAEFIRAGLIRVKRENWKDQYAKAILGGQGAVTLQ